ncbi:MAG: hypothetical protein KKH88_03295 [Nanoarchaeota archaeon]|nr:hypothetical protein [Nanoarchaeota archaeon]
MNKKGDYWSFTLLIVTIIVLGWTSWLVLTNSSPIERATGLSSILLYNVFDEVEADLMYMDKSLEYGFSDSLNELLLNGGFFESQNKENGYVLWKRDVNECYPTEDSIKGALSSYLNKTIVEDLDKINLSGDFEFTFEKEGNWLKIVGESALVYVRDLENIHVDYEVNPTLTYIVDYDLDQVMLKVLEVKGVIDSCGDNVGCWGSSNFNWSNNGKLFTFDVDLGKVENVFGETNLTLKGAVDFGSGLGKSSLIC